MHDQSVAELSNEYWTTLAQVMPLVGVGLVVEARSIASRWSELTPGLIKAAQSIMWAVTLGVLGLGEAQAIAALRGSPGPAYWSQLCEAAIETGFGVLVLAPAIELLFVGGADFLAAIFSAHPILRLSLLKQGRDIRQMTAKLDRSQVSLGQMAVDLDAAVSDLERQLATHKANKPGIDAPWVAHAEQLVADVKVRIDAAKTHFEVGESEHRLALQELRASLEDQEARLDAVSAAKRGVLARVFRSVLNGPGDASRALDGDG